MKQNITLSLEKGIIRDAKILAAKKSTSISALLAQTLTAMVKLDNQYKQARLDALADLDQGFKLGGKPASRESLHER